MATVTPQTGAADDEWARLLNEMWPTGQWGGPRLPGARCPRIDPDAAEHRRVLAAVCYRRTTTKESP